MRVADGGILGRRAAHVDNISRAGGELVGLHHRDIFKRAGMAVADEAIAIESAGKVRSAQAITGFENVKHSDDAARLAWMRQFDFDPFEERFLFEQRNQFLAIDRENLIFDRSLGAEAYIFYVNVTQHPIAWADHYHLSARVGRGGAVREMRAGTAACPYIADH